jgi:hypothetical protein
MRKLIVHLKSGKTRTIALQGEDQAHYGERIMNSFSDWATVHQYEPDGHHQGDAPAVDFGDNGPRRVIPFSSIEFLELS